MSLPIQAMRVRLHSQSRPVEGTPWLVLADRNVCGNTVYLVHADRDELVPFHHDEPYHAFLRAQFNADIYAQNHLDVEPIDMSIEHLQFHTLDASVITLRAA